MTSTPRTIPQRLQGLAWSGPIALVLCCANAYAAPLLRQPPTLRVAGDSAMATRSPEQRPATGWGESLPMLLRGDAVQYENRAADGRSSRQYLQEGLWARLMTATRSGDVVFIAFGQDDASKRPERYTAPEAFRANLERFVDEARMRGATPVLLTQVAQPDFRSGGLRTDNSPYADVVRAIAVQRQVPLMDMQRASEGLLREAGSEGAKTLFVYDSEYELRYLNHNTRYLLPIDDEASPTPCGAAKIAQRASVLMRAGGLEAWLEDAAVIDQRVTQVCNAQRDALKR
ncbi:GDSL-type esterase/lipase family protein [Lysobacter sp. CCNWLW3]|uniref:GDSL-type esterase/lipase family protein n=1 Tax=unclassified Lysobacter TaxID=2635362 RepID=UPI002FCF05B7